MILWHFLKRIGSNLSSIFSFKGRQLDEHVMLANVHLDILLIGGGLFKALQGEVEGSGGINLEKNIEEILKLDFRVTSLSMTMGFEGVQYGLHIFDIVNPSTVCTWFTKCHRTLSTCQISDKRAASAVRRGLTMTTLKILFRGVIAISVSKYFVRVLAGIYTYLYLLCFRNTFSCQEPRNPIGAQNMT